METPRQAGDWAPITDKEHLSVRCRGFYMGVPGFDGVRSSKVHGHGTATGPKQTTDKSFDQMAA